MWSSLYRGTNKIIHEQVLNPVHGDEYGKIQEVWEDMISLVRYEKTGKIR